MKCWRVILQTWWVLSLLAIDWYQAAGIAGLTAIVGGAVVATGKGFYALVHRLDEILEGSQVAKAANEKAGIIQEKLDTLLITVENLAKTTTATFASRTEDFQDIIHVAERRLLSLESEVAQIKIDLASVRGAGGDMQTKFSTIEGQLASIHSRLDALASTTPAPAGTGAGSEPV